MTVTKLSELLPLIADGGRFPVFWRGQEFVASLRRSTRAKRSKLRVSEGKLEVVLPHRAPLRLARALLEHHEQWAYKHLSKVSQRESTSLHFRGEPLVILRDSTWSSMAEYAEGVLVIGKGEADAQILEWMRNASRTAFEESVAQWATTMNLWPKRMQLRDQTSKWGACTSRGTVTFNWRIVMAPPEVLDYLVIHELAHLAEMNHSSRFWAIVEKHCPDYKAHRRWLRERGHLLRWPDSLESFVQEVGAACSA